MFDLNRFIKAQEKDYETALKEIKNGKKVSCWMWYIFPQIKGLGMTSMSNFYGIEDIEEAKEYLHNEILSKRLIEISNALLELENNDIKEIMGFPDNLKLKSSMTLFKKAEELSDVKYDNIFQKVLDKYYNGEEDNNTLVILEKKKFDLKSGLDMRNKNNEKDEENKESEENEENEEKENQYSIKSDNNDTTEQRNNNLDNQPENKDVEHLDEINTTESVDLQNEKDDENINSIIDNIGNRYKKENVNQNMNVFDDDDEEKKKCCDFKFFSCNII